MPKPVAALSQTMAQVRSPVPSEETEWENEEEEPWGCCPLVAGLGILSNIRAVPQSLDPLVVPSSNQTW